MPDTPESNENDDSDLDLFALTTDIVCAHVANAKLDAAELPALIVSVHRSLAGLGDEPAVPQVDQAPAVSIRASIKPDHIVCLEDGLKLKTLKRHLGVHHQMTPAQYRQKWNLPGDYPMVAPNYAVQRRALAMRIGLGRKASAPTNGPVAAPAKTPGAASRKKLSVSSAE